MLDSHAHLTSPELLKDIDDVVSRAHEAAVTTIINICTDKTSLDEGLKLVRRHKGIYNTAATTPHDVEEEGESFFPNVEAVADQLVAIGETGLDYYYEYSPKKLQQNYMSRYFELAIKTNLPIIFHCRDAFDDLFALAKEQYRDRPAVLHCFTGTLAEARQCLDNGWLISFSGIITFKKSTELQEVAKYVPLDRMLIETDAPYLAPQSRRGKRNEPAFVGEVAGKIAELLGIDLLDVIRKTENNGRHFFSLDASA